MTLAAVSMDAQTVQRNGKRPREKTKTGDKRGNEKLRQGNWLTRNAYRWHNPHCFVHGCGSHGKRLKGRKYYNMHLFWALKCFKKLFFPAELGIVSTETVFDLKSYTYVLTWTHISFPSACVRVWEDSAGPCRVCTEVRVDATPSTWPNAACVCFLCVCAFGILWVWTVCLAAQADCNLACHI